MQRSSSDAVNCIRLPSSLHQSWTLALVRGHLLRKSPLGEREKPLLDVVNHPEETRVGMTYPTSPFPSCQTPHVLCNPVYFCVISQKQTDSKTLSGIAFFRVTASTNKGALERNGNIYRTLCLPMFVASSQRFALHSFPA